MSLPPTMFMSTLFTPHHQSSLTFTFSLGNVEAGNGQRYFIKTGCHESFSYLLSHVAYIRGCAVGAPLEIPDEL